MSISRAVNLVHDENTDASTKTRALFHLRCLDTEEAALALHQCINNKSELIDHEVAYILGQMKQPVSIPFLLGLAEDKTVNPIVRHEAIEALGNFEENWLTERIKQFLEDDDSIIRESAVLAIRKLQQGKLERSPFSKYHSRDPAFPFDGSFEEARDILLNSTDITEKYRAIFFMRDLNTREAVEVLGGCFKDPSPLLRHEVAYVFGQMENPLSVHALVDVLENPNEAAIVRHEAAEALGNIGGAEAEECLRKHANSEIKIIKESVGVGLKISENDNDEYVDIDRIE